MDTDLVVRAQRGDKAAYALVAGQIADRFLAVARRILRDLDLAEDATQQAWIFVPDNRPGVWDRVVIEAETYEDASPEIEREIQQIVDSVMHGG
jgi:hypothetical protein